ncbi:MAG: rhomboid family intramembrane serine protease, partial [Gemmatimonadetes bacterium]|nr:rhomboid family intramembrane serine protease [Gemmatimonadota bacterium]
MTLVKNWLCARNDSCDNLHPTPTAGNVPHWLSGPNLEDRLGRWWYLAFYLVGGAIAGGVHVMWSPENPVVGASGAISAVTGGFLVFFPRTKIRVFMFFIIIGVIQIPAVWFIGAQIALNLFDQGLNAGSNVAYMAHLGGYVYGIGLGFTLLATGALPREAYDLFSLRKQARRRRVFRELTTKRDNPWSSGKPSGKVSAGHSEKEDPRKEELSRRRSEVSTLLVQHNIDEAARAYSQLLKDFESVILSRDAQLKLANHYYQNGEHEDAAASYDLFLGRHGTDREA